MHGVLHLGWDGSSPTACAATPILPFRYVVVYPPMLRQVEREWRARATLRKASHCRQSGSTSKAALSAPLSRTDHSLASSLRKKISKFHSST